MAKQAAAALKSKGKGKAQGDSKKQVAVPLPEPVEDDEEQSGSEDEDYDSDEDSETGGVSQRGFEALIKALGPEGVKAAMADAEDEDEEDEDEEDENMEDDEEDDDEQDTMAAVTAEMAAAQESSDVDPDALDLDDLGSEYSIDEDAVPVRKVTINNRAAMQVLNAGIKITDAKWDETLLLSSASALEVDPQDDLQREMAFYKLALEAVPKARGLAKKFDIPFSRPNDYYAEMVKSDEHMERVRTRLVDEAGGIKKSELAKKQRDLKKYGKQIQHEKLRAREQDKKALDDRLQGIKRKRKDGMEIGGDGGDFDVDIDNAIEGRSESSRGRGGGRGGRGGRDDPKMPRHARDAKYSLGGGNKRSKQNTKESTNDFEGGGGGRGGGRGGRGGRGGGRGGGGRGGGGGGRGGGQRPGKSRRAKA